MSEAHNVALFEGKKVRKIWHENEWFFSVVDAIQILTDSTDANDYWYRLKKREVESGGIELSTICRQLKLVSSDGKSVISEENYLELPEKLKKSKKLV